MRSALVILLLGSGGAARPKTVATPEPLGTDYLKKAAKEAHGQQPAADGGASSDTGRRLGENRRYHNSSMARITTKPRIIPFGGSHQAVLGVELTALPGDTIHFTIDGTPPTRESPFVRSGQLVHIENPYVTLRAFTRSWRPQAEYDSDETAANYDVQMGAEDVCIGATGVCNAIDGRTGVGVFVPYYHGRQSCGNVTKHIFDPDEECPEFPGMTRNGGTRRNNTDFYSSMLLGVDLVTEPYNRVRIHGINTDFADYYTYDQSRDTLGVERTTGKLEKLYYQLGIGAYKGQLLVRDVAEDLGDASLRGFFHGFVAKHTRRNGTRFEKADLIYPYRPFISHEELAQIRAEMMRVEQQGQHELPLLDEPCYPADYTASYETNSTDSKSVAHGFMAPFFDGQAYSGRLVRHALETTRTRLSETFTNYTRVLCCATYEAVKGMVYRPILGDSQARWEEVEKLYNRSVEYCALNETYNATKGTIEFDTRDEFRNATTTADGARVLDTVDLTRKDGLLRGFMGGFSLGDYAYFVPYFDGLNAGHKVARVHVRDCVPDGFGPGAAADNFTGCDYEDTKVEFLDLHDKQPDLSGFFGGFAYETTGGRGGASSKRYGFLVPYKQVVGPIGGVNSELTADGYTAQIIPDLGNHARQALGGDHLESSYHGRLVRIDLDRFGECAPSPGACDAVDVLALTTFDQDLRGFASGFVAGSRGYLVPYRNRDLRGAQGFFGKVVRVDLENLRIEKVLDLTQYQPLPRGDPNYAAVQAQLGGENLRGFIGGASWGQYGLLFPHRNDMYERNYNKRAHSSLLVRLDLNDFTLRGVLVLDLATVFRQQTPRIPEPMLRGFLHGFVSGAHAYLVPHFSRVFFGKIVRVDMRDFEVFARLQLRMESTDIQPVREDGFQTSGVQYVDVERTHPQLVGFSGGYASRSEGAISRALLEPEERASWWKVLNALPLDERKRDWMYNKADRLNYVPDLAGNATNATTNATLSNASASAAFEGDVYEPSAYQSIDYQTRFAISPQLIKHCEKIVRQVCTYRFVRTTNRIQPMVGGQVEPYKYNRYTETGDRCPCWWLSDYTIFNTDQGYSFLEVA